MPRTSMRELVESWRPRYLGASRKEKGLILDESVALTGYPASPPFGYFATATAPSISIGGMAPRVSCPGLAIFLA